MYDLIVKEVPEVLKEANLSLVSAQPLMCNRQDLLVIEPDEDQDWSRVSLMGHSMGGMSSALPLWKIASSDAIRARGALPLPQKPGDVQVRLRLRTHQVRFSIPRHNFRSSDNG